MRTCSMCDLDKEDSHFEAKIAGEFYRRCIECRTKVRTWNQTYYAGHAKKLNTARASKEARKEYVQQYNIEHRDHRNALQRKYAAQKRARAAANEQAVADTSADALPQS
jgi:hypothetical protein